jgi:hypothetical protein
MMFLGECTPKKKITLPFAQKQTKQGKKAKFLSLLSVSSPLFFSLFSLFSLDRFLTTKNFFPF